MLMVIYIIFNIIRNSLPYHLRLLAQGKRQVGPFQFPPSPPADPARTITGKASCPAPRCCLEHDCCYEKLKHFGCQPVLNSYHFHIVNGTVVCE